MITLKCDFFMSFYTYILKSETSAGYYFGHCKDLQKRIANHNAGKVRSTKHNRPWHLHYFEKFETKSDAYKRELFFKSLDGRRWLKSNNIIWRFFGCLFFAPIFAPERWLSGLKRRSWKPLTQKVRGFESLSLRHIQDCQLAKLPTTEKLQRSTYSNCRTTLLATVVRRKEDLRKKALVYSR